MDDARPDTPGADVPSQDTSPQVPPSQDAPPAPPEQNAPLDPLALLERHRQEIEELRSRAKVREEETREFVLGPDQSMGVFWIRPRGKLLGVLYGTLRQKSIVDVQITNATHPDRHTKQETPVEPVEQETPVDPVEFWISCLGQFLVMPDGASGLRPATRPEIEAALDFPDLPEIYRLIFPKVNPLRIIKDAGLKVKGKLFGPEDWTFIHGCLLERFNLHFADVPIPQLAALMRFAHHRPGTPVIQVAPLES